MNRSHESKFSGYIPGVESLVDRPTVGMDASPEQFTGRILMHRRRGRRRLRRTLAVSDKGKNDSISKWRQTFLDGE